MKPCAVFLIALCLLTTTAYSQPGATTGVDGRLGILGTQLATQGRVGTFPTGYTRLSMATTSCNPGSINLPWLQASDVRHPYIGFMVARLDPGATRLTQISHRSYIKHGFFALNNAQCSSCSSTTNNCRTGTGLWLGVSCSDTYSTSNNASSLAPADDVNPWAGTWNSASQPNGGSSNCPRMTDADLTVAGASYYYCAHYVFPSWTQSSVSPTATCVVGTGTLSGSPVSQPASCPLGLMCEPDAVRDNNLASRQMNVTYTSGNATFSSTGTQLDGTVLNRWTGATVTSNTNGSPAGVSDGRVYCAVKVTGPVNGKYHYEYALHNRDNKGGVGVFRVPSCPGAIVSGVGFHDVDVPAVATNDWTFANGGTELTWTAPAGNALNWNMLFNFWFDSDALPVAGNVTLDQAAPLAGTAASFTVSTTVPSGNFNVNLGPGCSSGAVPALYTTGTPNRATLGNATFGLQCSPTVTGDYVELYYTLTSGIATDYAPCNVYLGPDLSTATYLMTAVADGFGVATFALPVPNDPFLEGVIADMQAVDYATGGTILGIANLSNGLRLRLGSAIPNCP